MGTVRVIRELAVPASAVWAVLADFGGFLDWATGGAGTIRIEGDGEGMVRHLSLPGVGEMAERLDRLDHQTRTQCYSLASGTPIGMGSYSATVVVSETAGGCRLDWTGEFEPAPGADAEMIRQGLEGSYNGMSQSLAAAAVR